MTMPQPTGAFGILSAAQMRMARAGLSLTTRELGDAVGLSAMSISRYERGELKVISIATMQALLAFFQKRGVFFGPKDSISLRENVFQADRWFMLACFRLLEDHGIHPTSTMLCDAYRRQEEGQS